MQQTTKLFFWLFLAIFLSACDASREQTTSLPTRAATAVSPLVALPTAPAATATAIANTATPTVTNTPTPTATATPTSTPTATPTATAVPFGTITTIGYSAGGRPIENYQFGNGSTLIILIGGIHGGYEWNSTLLIYELIDYLFANPDIVPPSITLHIIPAANPDGLFRVTGVNGRFTVDDVALDIFPGRFNDNGVDLNRNWDCNWQPEGTWRDQPVDAGDYPFSEPENVALRDFIVPRNPAVTIFYHSAFNAIFAAGCPNVGPRTRELADVYATAANYPIYEQFTSYEITGDSGDWLTTQNIPSITVELSTHSSLDWTRNLNGLLAVLDYYGNLQP